MSKLVQFIQEEKKKIQPPRLLIVESDETIASLLVEYLAPTYQVALAENGREAIMHCQERPPHLVLVDTALPDMTANELFQNLYAFKLVHQMPIIFLGQQNETHVQRMAALETGVDDYISKPFDIVELELRVRNALPPPRQVADAITGLPGWMAVEAEISRRLPQTSWTMSLFRLENLRPYHLLFGTVAANEVRREIVNMLLDQIDALGDATDFIGTIGAEVFVVLASRHYHEALVTAVHQQFVEALYHWYEADIVEQGYFLLPDETKASLLVLQATAVTNQSPPFKDSMQVIETAEKRLNQFTNASDSSGAL